MGKNLNARVSRLEWRTRRPKVVRTIYAAYPDNYDDRESHDTLRARLRIKPEPYVIDHVYYQLREGSPPRLKRPDIWGHTVMKEEEVVEVPQIGTDAPQTPPVKQDLIKGP